MERQSSLSEERTRSTTDVRVFSDAAAMGLESAEDSSQLQSKPLISALTTGQRKRLLRALTSMDKGEFRWEILTPWVKDRELTRMDKVFICLTFIAVAVYGQAAFEPSTSVLQHMSYVANFFSYTIGNQVGYRLIAIAASLLEIFAYDEEGGSWQKVVVPGSYNTIFILVNLYYVLRWLLNRIDTALFVLEPIEEQLFTRCFEPLGVGPYQFLKLVNMATWTRPNTPTALTVEGEPVTALYVSIAGDFDVVTGGSRVASIPPFQVIGEVAALENLQSSDGKFHQAARATVLAEPGSLYASWSHDQLYKLQGSDAEFARAIRLAISRTLSHKLGSARKSTGKLLTAAGAKNALAVLPVVSPDQERIYTSCFARGGFEDADAFVELMRVASSPKERTQLVGSRRMLAIARGSATAYDASKSVRLQTFQAPQLIGAEQFLEALFVAPTISQTAPYEESSRDDSLLVELDPDAQFYSWEFDDLVLLVRSNSNVRAGLNRLWASTLCDAPQKTQELIAELPQAPKFSSTVPSAAFPLFRSQYDDVFETSRDDQTLRM